MIETFVALAEPNRLRIVELLRSGPQAVGAISGSLQLNQPQVSKHLPWRYLMRASNGFEAGFSGKYLEIEAPHRVVQTEIFDPFPDAVSVVTVLLTESGGKTTLTSRSRYPSQEVRDQVIASGMEDGMRESFRQLTDVVASIERRV